MKKILIILAFFMTLPAQAHRCEVIRHNDGKLLEVKHEKFPNCQVFLQGPIESAGRLILMVGVADKSDTKLTLATVTKGNSEEIDFESFEIDSPIIHEIDLAEHPRILRLVCVRGDKRFTFSVSINYPLSKISVVG